MKRFISTFILICSISICLKAKNIQIKCNNYLQDQFSKAQTTYVISQRIDLKGIKLQLPAHSTLKFVESGEFINGTIVGDLSHVVSDKQMVFEPTVTVEGTWENKYVYGEWVGLTGSSDNNRQFSNLFTLANSSSITHVYTSQSIYPVKAVKNSAPILIPSNVYWHNASTIQMQECDFTHYSIVLLDKINNVTIDGGEFIGDVKTHIGDKGEWGHGIKCAGVTNVTLKNLTCSYCWGDGIDLIEGRDEDNQPTIVCNRIVIDNVKCLYNRRQGMSIEAAHKVRVSDSEFAYTGHPLSTKPSAGIDIEEWNTDGHKMNYLSFKNCFLHDNVGYDLQCEPNWKMGRDGYLTYENNISFNSCSMDSCRVNFTNGVRFNGCNIQDIKVQYCNNIIFSKSKIEKLVESRNDSTIKLKKCKGKAFLLSYERPMGFIGMSTMIGFGLFAYKYFNNEINRNNNNS